MKISMNYMTDRGRAIVINEGEEITPNYHMGVQK